MKIRVTLKDPDGFGDAVQDAVTANLKAIDGLTADEREELREGRMEAANEALSTWVEYGEYLRVEFDTDAMTATVLPLRALTEGGTE